MLIVPESVLPAAVEKRGSVTAVMHEEINVLIVDRMITQKKRECQATPKSTPKSTPKKKKKVSFSTNEDESRGTVEAAMVVMQQHTLDREVAPAALAVAVTVPTAQPTTISSSSSASSTNSVGAAKHAASAI